MTVFSSRPRCGLGEASIRAVRDREATSPRRNNLPAGPIESR
jgi:hypothetical protein